MFPSALLAIAVFFSPKGGCEAEVVKQLSRAQRSIHIQAYSFTAEPIEKACEAAKQRGVGVIVVLDKSYETESPKVAAELKAAGIAVLIDSKHAIAHNKIIIIDAQVVITGSFNFTEQAEHQNAENMLVIKSAGLGAKYEANFALHSGHSTLLP